MSEADTSAEDAVSIPAMARRYYRASERHSAAWRTDAKDWYGIISGEQWPADDLAILKEQERPAVTFNRVLRTVNAVLGTQIANRQQTQFYPREMGDVKVNEILSAGAEWVRDGCDAEDEESDSFEDMCISGMGWTETRMDFDRNADGDIVIERIDPLEMYWDPKARKRNIVDAKWVMHITDIDIDEFEQRWPDADLDGASAAWDGPPDDTTARTHVYPQDAYKESQASAGAATKEKTSVRVAHLQWCEYKDAYRVGKKAERVSSDTFGRLKKKLDQSGVPYLKQRAVVWKRAFVAGTQVLEKGDCPFPDGPTLRCMTYKRDRNSNTWFGLIKAMVDPQRFGNKFFSVILDILNKGSKGGVMMEKGAVEDPRAVEKNWAKSDAVIMVKDGALTQGKVKEKPPVVLPPGLDRLMTFSLDAVHEVTGINLELLGLANRDQPGVLEHQRKQAGLTIIAPLFDAMRRYRKDQGRVLLHFIQKFISDGRLIRIMGQNGNQAYVPLTHDPAVAEYDVIVDESPTSPNMKERVFAILQELLPVLMKAGIPVPPEVLDYAPIPSSLAEKWKEQLQGQGQLPPQVRQQIDQLQQMSQQLSQENQQLKSKKDEAMMGLQIDQQQAATKAAIDAKAAETKHLQTVQDVQLQRWKAEQEIALKEREMRANIMIKASQATGPDGQGSTIDMAALARILDGGGPRAKRMHVERDPQTGFMKSILVEDLLGGDAAGNA